MATPIVNFEPSPLEGDETIRRALEINPDSSLVLDLSGTVRVANLPAIRHLGPSQGDLVGAHWLSLFAEADRQAAEQALEAAAAGEIRRFCASVPGAGGGRTWDSTIAPLRDAAGAPFGLIAVAKDVTELEELRRVAEEQVRGLTYRFEILRAAADAVGLVGLEIDFIRGVVTGGVDSNLPEHNPRPPRLGQFSIESVLEEIYHVEDRPRVRALIERTRVFGEPLRFDARYVRVDGGQGWVRIIGEPVYKDGICIAVRGAGMDITEEVAAQEDVLRAQKRLSLATQLAGMEVYELDFNRQTLIRGGSSETIFAPPLRYEDLWPDPLCLVDPQDRARIEAAWIQSQKSQTPFSAEFRLSRHEGDQEVWVYAVAELLQHDGSPHQLVGAVLDISERKRAEQQILQTMAKMREHEARQKLLLDELNHRVKNTLAAVQSIAVQTLTDGRSPLEGRDLFIDRLLALSSTHNLLVKHAWRSASLQELMEATLEPYGHVYGRDGPDLLFNPNFAVSVGMALHELATNALKHGAWSAGGRVDVSTEVHAQDVVITWREHGGPRVVAPTKRGFGSRLLQRGVAGELGGKVTLDFAPDGLVCSIQVSISPRLQVIGRNHGN